MRYHHKHKDCYAPDPEPSKLRPAPKVKRRKPEPRYRVERWFTPWWRGHSKGYWSRIAKCRTLAEAKHQMQKPTRGPYHTNPVDVRIVDTTDGSIVASERLHPAVKP